MEKGASAPFSLVGRVELLVAGCWFLVKIKIKSNLSSSPNNQQPGTNNQEPPHHH
jgi:hypothetical protein